MTSEDDRVVWLDDGKDGYWLEVRAVGQMQLLTMLKRPELHSFDFDTHPNIKHYLHWYVCAPVYMKSIISSYREGKASVKVRALPGLKEPSKYERQVQRSLSSARTLITTPGTSSMRAEGMFLPITHTV